METYRSLTVLLHLIFLLSSHSTGSEDVNDVKIVHLIFMNHLDVGYDIGFSSQTGFVNNILNTYFHEYFPRAVNLSLQLRADEYVENFIYTTHPWLVSLYLDCPKGLRLGDTELQCPNDTEVKYFQDAIKRGDVTWHAGPMNMQPENMNQRLFEMSLNISFDLDAKFGIKRSHPTFSQRDVPGLTQAAIPSLLQRGIAAVSVGVNPGTSPPAVPRLFRWQYNTYGPNEILAAWHPGGYPLRPGPNPAHPGGLSTKDCIVVPGFIHALCYAFISDNGGPPQNIQEILGYYEVLRKEFPTAKIKGSTFEEYFSEVDSIRQNLPIVTREIGDTWIQGVASDPLKMAYYRAISRTLTDCIDAGQCKMSDPRIVNAVRMLIKPPEHTWGLPDVNDTYNWSNSEFNIAKLGHNYKDCETAWLEQREFLQMALQDLADVHPLSEQINNAMSELHPEETVLTPDYHEIEDVTGKIRCDDGKEIAFNIDGSIRYLTDPYNAVNWTTGSPMAQILYFTYNETDFKNMAKQYNYTGGAGFDKPNSTNANPESRVWYTQIEKLYKSNKTDVGFCKLLLKLKMKDSKAHTWYGAPEYIWIKYESHGLMSDLSKRGFDVTVQWSNKTPTRLAESLMFYFSPELKNLKWSVDKMGRLIQPENVVLNGSQYVHAVDSGVFYTYENFEGLHLYTQDVPVVSIATRDHPPSPFPVPLKPIFQRDILGVAFNLYNNIWNTNYILWYPYDKSGNFSFINHKDFKSRFTINFFKGVH